MISSQYGTALARAGNKLSWRRWGYGNTTVFDGATTMTARQKPIMTGLWLR